MDVHYWGELIKLLIIWLTQAIWKKEKLREEWKDSIIVTIHKKGNKTDFNSYRCISDLPNTYKIVSNILCSRLIPYAKEIIGDLQCGFRSNWSTIDQIFTQATYLKKMGIL